MNSESTRTGSLHCTCRPGYFRAENESADRPCTRECSSLKWVAPQVMTARRSHLSSSFLVYFMTTASQFQEVWYEWECSRGDCSSIVATPADSKLMSRTLRLSAVCISLCGYTAASTLTERQFALFQVQQHQGPETMPLGALPGWVVFTAMVLFVLLLAFLFVLCRRKSHNRKQMSDLDVLDTYKQVPRTSDLKINSFANENHHSNILRHLKASKSNSSRTSKVVMQTGAHRDLSLIFKALVEFTFDIDPAAVFITEVIGGGEFGDVCKGGLKRSMIGGGIVDVVAIKTLKPGSSAKAKADFLLEASIMGQFAHPNVIRLIGVVTRSEPVMIVEFSVLTALCFIPDGQGILRLMSVLLQDLAARNVLVDAEMICKIADFGLSRGVDDSAEQEYTTNGGKIPVRWTSPEAITHRKFTAASDVWSFGVLVWEVCSFGERPYWDWTNQKVISEVMLGYRLPAPMDCPVALHRLMLWCWRLDRHERPTFAQILAILEKYARNPELIHLDSVAFTTGSPGGPMIPNIHPSSLPSLMDFLRSLNMGHCMEKLNKEGIFTVTDLARRSHLDMLAIGEIGWRDLQEPPKERGIP
ncbi:unnamed protein product [Heligmosomoides polygyrus]|uniref:receptor protein-tyrosine kinase n=1 Tax=Heligmosomoides polygyrus TaxID=6339 RepID=A0A3P7ZL86_HELPZ|nr:unnamed protein product [Heligmosomoides polygyrus]